MGFSAIVRPSDVNTAVATPSIDELTMGYRDRANAIADSMRPISNDQINNMINSGSLGATLGFTTGTGSSILGMTPESLQASMQTYRNPTQQLNDMGQMVESVTGKHRIGQAKLAAENNIFGVEASNKNTQDNLASAEARSNSSKDFDWNKFNAEHAQRAEQSAAALEEARRFHSDTIREHQKDRALKERELAFIKSNSQIPGGLAASPGLPFDDKLQSHYTEQAKYWQNQNSSNPLKDDSSSRVNANINNIYALSLGKPWDSSYEVNSQDATGHFFGATRLRLTPTGYLGLKQDKSFGVNAQGIPNWGYVNQGQPVLELPGYAPRKGSASGGNTTGVLKHAPDTTGE